MPQTTQAEILPQVDEMLQSMASDHQQRRLEDLLELSSILVYSIPEPSHDDQAARFC
jgi:hypothetical protein